MRRGSTQLTSKAIAGGLALFLALGLGLFFLIRPSSSFQNLERLDIESYSETAKPFTGGTYFVEGIMDNILVSSSSKGRLVSVTVSSPKGLILIPILIPQNMGSFNLQKGQALKIKVKAVDNGLLKAEKIEKTP
ncbi:MAG: hypothetical protein EBR01_13710 [Proteobacteria bacterium]|nr:hypothetical protein [Pseudomonadota bacterium]